MNKFMTFAFFSAFATAMIAHEQAHHTTTAAHSAPAATHEQHPSTVTHEQATAAVTTPAQKPAPTLDEMEDAVVSKMPDFNPEEVTMVVKEVNNQRFVCTRSNTQFGSVCYPATIIFAWYAALQADNTAKQQVAAQAATVAPVMNATPSAEVVPAAMNTTPVAPAAPVVQATTQAPVNN